MVRKRSETPLHRVAARFARLAWPILALLAPSGTAVLARQGPPEAFGQRWNQPQSAAPAAVVPGGQWFQLNHDFGGRIARAELTSHVGAGPYAAQAGMNEMFLVLTIEVRNRGNAPLTPPVREVKWLSTRDGMRTIRADMPLGSRFNDPRFGGAAHVPVPPGGSGAMLAIYRLPYGANPDGLYYTVQWEPRAGQLVLAQIPR
jgi:hypothetical protein